MPNPYTDIAIDLNDEQAVISTAFGNAEFELLAQGAPQTGFLEIYWNTSSNQIQRLYDNVQVSTLSASEQYRLYPQLGGLFNAAMRALLYP